MRIAYVKAERAKIEKRRDEIIAEAIKDAENRIKELEKIDLPEADLILLSLDGDRERHNAIRGNTYDIIMENIKC